MKKIFFLFLLLFTFYTVKTQTYDSLRVSLLTVEPHSKAVWTIFGHTALRLYDPVLKIDEVYNWGTFDFEAPNFIMNFVKGKTDYFLSTSDFQSVMRHHYYEGATVTEQTLNISDDQKAALLNFLRNNLLPENRGYRYSFIFDNCTTRPRDIIEQFCGGTLIYPEQKEKTTFRQLIHLCAESYPWTKFGIDCVIGSGADSLISYRYELFLPEKLMDALDRSVVKNQDGSERLVVLRSELILKSLKPNKSSEQDSLLINFFNTPFAVGLTLFSLYLFLVILSFFFKNRFSVPFALLFFIAGAGGCIVAFLNFFSLHPCVQLNWNLIWLHPLHFIACVGFFLKKHYKLIYWYHTINFLLLSVFLLVWNWVTQELNMAFIPLILCLCIVSGSQVLKLKQK